jgi:A/G-specific adenine glycosylase
MAGDWFGQKLIRWYEANKRELPWRGEPDPYKIWLSEVILQQTQVQQGLAYYLRFTERFPDVRALAQATEEEVLRLWQGLGYYSRARNLHAAAKSILSDFNGVFPSDYKNIRRLRGIGDYTAAAISSISFGAPYAVVDGNVYRVLSRLFGIEDPIDLGTGKRKFAELAASLLVKAKPGIYNQAVMEFGATFCKPVNPPCGACIFAGKCEAKKSGRVALLPVKSKKTTTTARYFNYLVATDKKRHVLLVKRTGNDIWKGLYEFPLVESASNLSEAKLMRHPLTRQLCPDARLVKVSRVYKHILTHQKLHARFFLVETGTLRKNNKRIAAGDIERYPLPRLIEKVVDEWNLKEIL